MRTISLTTKQAQKQFGYILSLVLSQCECHQTTSREVSLQQSLPLSCKLLCAFCFGVYDLAGVDTA